MSAPELDKIKQAYQNLLPEQQVIFGIFFSLSCLSIQFIPEELPELVQPIIDLLTKIPLYRLSLWISTGLGLLGSADGMRRFYQESLPFYRAYFRIFWAGNKTKNQ